MLNQNASQNNINIESINFRPSKKFLSVEVKSEIIGKWNAKQYDMDFVY